MEELMAQQKVTIHAIERALDNFKKIGKANYTIGVVRNRLQQVNDHFARFEQLHGQIMAAASNEFIMTDRYFTEDRFDKCEAAFLTASDYMAEWMSRLESPPPSQESSTVSPHHPNASPRSAFHLPRINLPKFTGEFREWEAFRDQFTALIIDNRDLLDVNRLQYLHSCVKGISVGLLTLGHILVYLLAQKLDKGTRKAWELKLGDTLEYPTYDQLDRFLISQIRALENILPASSPAKGSKQNSSVQSHAASASSTKCPMCQKTHSLSACPDFHNKSVAQRRDLAKKYRCCFNCLSTRHIRDACSSKNTCRHCQQKHHTLLHAADANNNSSTIESSPSSTETKTDFTDEVTSHLVSHTSFSKSNILSATAWIKVSGLNGRHSIVRTLLDQGSVTTLITERLAQRLRLPRTRVSVSITGIGETAATARSAARVHVSARDGTGPSPSVSALVLKSLTTYVPQRVPDITNLLHIRKLPLADSDLTSAASIDVIIGADLYGAILLPEVRNRAPHEPVAQNSIFGWFLSGPMPMPSQSRPARIQTHHCTVLSEISDQLKRFWEIEELPRQTHLSPEEIRCEEHFVSTHSRAPNGQYIVRLPFKSGLPIDIGESKSSAIALYSSLESRLKANPDLAREYHDFLAEYERLGHMTKAPLDDPPDRQVTYIPHHAVVRENSATTRLRVVFNAS
ncbi:uncharacterized protein [Temnothorax nylanderi]|uniref:uncharacterized protein n=1 Tax=Temnothorax nylanderi TaxID=102681 RepID=UPI003A8B81CE